MGDPTPASRCFPTSMLFFQELEEHKGEKPYYSTIPFRVPGAKQTNYSSIEQQVFVRDIRATEADFKLDECGFELAHHDTSFSDWRDGAKVKREHYPEMEAFLKQRLNADRVILFDHSLRRTGITNENAKVGEEYSAPPSSRPHVDHTLASAIRQIRVEFEDDADFILRGRCQQVNIWRPLFGPVDDHPLALCDARSVDRSDLVAVDLVFPHYVSELYKVYYNPNQEWYYLGSQMPEEVWIIKMCDSVASPDNGISQWCVHSSFVHPETPADAKRRESIEMRALVLHYPSSG